MFRAKLFTRVYCSECELHSLRVLSDMDPRERERGGPKSKDQRANEFKGMHQFDHHSHFNGHCEKTVVACLYFSKVAVVAVAASDLQVGWIPTYLDPVPPIGRSKGVNLA